MIAAGPFRTIEPIVLSGRALAPQFLAVLMASSDDPTRPGLYRAVHLEVFADRGVRLTATNSYWLAQGWAPSIDDPDCPRPSWDELGDVEVTLVDDEWRLRDLLKHVSRLTKKADSPDIEVVLDATARAHDDDQPTLAPDLAAPRTLVKIPAREQVLVAVHEAAWVSWRPIWRDFHAKAALGVSSQMSLSPDLVADVCRAARIVGGELRWSWCDNEAAVVEIMEPYSLGTWRLSALVMGLRRPDPNQPTTEPGTTPPVAAIARPPRALPGGAIEVSFADEDPTT